MKITCTYKTHFSSAVKIVCMVTVVIHANHVINKPQWPVSSGYSVFQLALLILGLRNAEHKCFCDLGLV